MRLFWFLKKIGAITTPDEVIEKYFQIKKESVKKAPTDISNIIVGKDFKDFHIFLGLGKRHFPNIIVGKYSTVGATKLKTYSVKDSYEITCFQKNMAGAELGHALSQAKDKIDILEISLDIIEQNYLSSLITALENNKQLKLRILALDPDGYFAQKRAEQLGLAIANYRNELHGRIQSIIGKLSKFGGQFSLRIYDDSPTKIIFIIDNYVYICTVTRNVRSREELCTFKLEKRAADVKGFLLFHFDAIFDAIWSNARDYQRHILSEKYLEVEKQENT